MKYLILFFSLFAFTLHADYARYLKGVAVDEETMNIHFILDNDTCFFSELDIYEENKLFALDKLIGGQVFIKSDPRSSAFSLICENPSRKGKQRICFSVGLPKETYDSLLTVLDFEVDAHWYGTYVTVILSDGSRWNVESDLGANFATTQWAQGDRIIVTEKFDSKNRFYLVNTDVSGDQFVDYHKTSHEHWYSMRDARCLLVSSCTE